MHIKILIRFCALTFLLGCSSERSNPAQSEPESEVAEATPEAVVPSASVVTPWAPRQGESSFLSRAATSFEEGKLGLEDYTLKVDVANGIATVTLDVSVSNPTKVQAEAVIELPIPPGAAVTGATLWVDSKPIAGVMLERSQVIFNKFVMRRRDPLLVTWATAERLNISLFPMAANETRRFSITWVEPAVGSRQWVPSFRHGKTLLGFPTAITVNGEIAQRDDSWVAIPDTTPAVSGDFRLQVQQDLQPAKVAVLLDTSQNPENRYESWKDFEKFKADVDELGIEVSVTASDWYLHDLGSGEDSSKFFDIHLAGLFDQAQALAWAKKAAGTEGVVAVFSEKMPKTDWMADYGLPVYWVGKHNGRYQHELVGRTGGRAVRGGAALAKSLQRLSPPGATDFEWLPLDAATGHLVWLGHKKGAALSEPMSPEEALYHRAMLRRGAIPENKIVSPSTSILVLESEQAYKRWGTDNKAAAAQSRIGSGSFQTIGHGSGANRSVRHKRQVGPKIRIGSGTVAGNLDQKILRRYVRRALSHFPYCYEKWSVHGLTSSTTLTTKFVVTAKGLEQPKASSSSSGDEEVMACIRAVLTRLVVPKLVGSDHVTAEYTFEVAAFPAPVERWSQARTILANSPGFEKEIGDLFGYRGAIDSTQLAWWLVLNHMRLGARPSSYLVVADLLYASTKESDKADARRIMSELADWEPEVVIGIFESWGASDDARRVRDLAR